MGGHETAPTWSFRTYLLPVTTTSLEANPVRSQDPRLQAHFTQDLRSDRHARPSGSSVPHRRFHSDQAADSRRRLQGNRTEVDHQEMLRGPVPSLLFCGIQPSARRAAAHLCPLRFRQPGASSTTFRTCEATHSPYAAYPGFSSSTRPQVR